MLKEMLKKYDFPEPDEVVADSVFYYDKDIDFEEESEIEILQFELDIYIDVAGFSKQIKTDQDWKVVKNFIDFIKGGE